MKIISLSLKWKIFLFAQIGFTGFSASAKSDLPYYFQCQQVCADMVSRNVFQVMTNNTESAQYLIYRSCENVGKKVLGKMECLPIKIKDQETEAYQACLNGTNTTAWWLCRTTGKVYIMKKGAPTQSVDLKFNLSKKSFSESDQALLELCKKYQHAFPDSEIYCALLYHDVWKQ